MSLETINYKGKPVPRSNGQFGTIGTVYYQHVYRMSGLAWPGFPEPTKRHACLRFGDWCWSDVHEHPKDVIYYARLKLRRFARFFR